MEAGRPPVFGYRVIGLVTALLVVAGGIAGYRVLAPGTILDHAKTAYPRSAPAAQPGVYGTLLAAPIVVDGRLRVYADKRQVFADNPVNIKSTMSPFWSYRRWPTQLLGVVAVGTTVVSQWSDGEVVGIDATTGNVAWQANTPVPDGLAFTGRRTGASTVWDPAGLYTAGQTVVAVGGWYAQGYDVRSGRPLWRQPLPQPRCADTFTGPDIFVSVATCGPPAVHAVDARTGAALSWPQSVLAPVGCALGHSGCLGVRDSGGAWAIGAGGVLTPAPALRAPGVWAIGNVAIVPKPGGDVAGVGLTDNKQLWMVSGRVLAVEPDAVHLVVEVPYRPFPEIITIDPATGQELSGYPLNVKGSGPFDIGPAYAADGYLFIERSRPGATADQPDSAYFYPSPNVVVAGS